MKWSLLLHIYQPPNQRPDIIDLVCKESYEGLLDLLLETPYPVTLNVTGILTEQLAQLHKDSVLGKLQALYKKPNITFTNTGFTHPLFPLWPAEEITHQLAANLEAQKKYLDSEFKSAGLYLPECAYSTDLDPVLKKENAKWILIDELSLVSKTYHAVVKQKGSTQIYLVRHRELSRALATDPALFFEFYHQIKGGEAVVALDGEAFGHFDSQSMGRLRAVLAEHGRDLVKMSDLAKETPKTIELRAASWETTPSDLRRHQPFPLWKDQSNLIHRYLWHFYDQLYRALTKSGGLKKNDWVRRHFDNAISSCYFWWANLRRTAGPFKMEVWNPDLIVMGITEAIKAARSDSRLTSRQKWHLETEQADLLKLIWRTHWKYKG